MHGCSTHPVTLISVDDAVDRLLATCPAPPAIEAVALHQALGRILAAPVCSPIEVPAHDNSAMDGYAVRLADLAETRTLPVSQQIPAGRAPQPLAPASVARIFTGAPIPAGADAVVMQEQCEVQGGRVVLPADIAPGQNIRRAGEDVRTGRTVLQEGVRLRPQEIGMAASVGVPELRVRRRLRVALLTTGSELVRPGQALAPGQIYDSNGPMMAAMLAQLGYECIGPANLPDDLAATRAALERAAAEADVILTTGGVSVGEEDHVKPAVQALGAVDLWRVAIRPGKPFAFGRVGETPFLGLPGNPVSVFVTFLLLARPFLARLQGRYTWATPEFHLPAGFSHTRPDSKRCEYLRARLNLGVVEIHPHQGSGVLSSAAWAHGLVRVEPGQEIHPRDCVPYIPIANLLS
jgi:molybdopterin molybdotransferase